MTAFDASPIATANRNRYTSPALTVMPDPPQAGLVATLALELSNPGTQAITIRRIEPAIAHFGIGVTWEPLAPLGPLTVDPGQISRVACEWTPKECGHRCLRVSIHFADPSQPTRRVGRNMRVVESETARQSVWRVPFAVGNPLDRAAPVQLRVQHDPMLQQVSLVVNNRLLLSGESITLVAHEEVQGTLLVLAETPQALESAVTVEGFIEGQFLDGLEVVVRKPAVVADAALSPVGEAASTTLAVSEGVTAFYR